MCEKQKQQRDRSLFYSKSLLEEFASFVKMMDVYMDDMTANSNNGNTAYPLHIKVTTEVENGPIFVAWLYIM